MNDTTMNRLARSPGSVEQPLRQAGWRDIEFVRQVIASAIGETLGEAEDFRSQELARFSRARLRALMEADRNYVLIATSPDGKDVGILVSGPEQGALVLYWVYLLPEYRLGSFALKSLGSYLGLWDHGRFHKITAYTRASNRPPQALLMRKGFRKVALLEKHLFGEDFVLFDYPLTKAVPGYDPMVYPGFLKRLTLALRAWFATR